jgi:flagellar biosynthesis component FlhA
MFKATASAATVIATALQCENVGAIAADLSEPLMTLELCDDKAQSTISDLVCPQIATLLTSIAAGTIPTNWQCSATVVSEIVKTQIMDGCAKLIK